MTAISRNMYIDKLDIVDKYKNTYNTTTKMKSNEVKVDVKNNDTSGEKNQILQYSCKRIYCKLARSRFC